MSRQRVWSSSSPAATTRSQPNSPAESAGSAGLVVRPARCGALQTGGTVSEAWRRWSSHSERKGYPLVDHAFPDAGGDMSKPPTGGFDGARIPEHGVDP